MLHRSMPNPKTRDPRSKIHPGPERAVRRIQGREVPRFWSPSASFTNRGQRGVSNIRGKVDPGLAFEAEQQAPRRRDEAAGPR